jgi:GT2 family glycosyltransferase
LISLSRNLFFGEGNNIAIEAARGKYVLFLNNDVTISSDVTSELIAAFKKNFSAGAIGPKFKFPNGATQEAGAFLLPDGLSLRGGQLGQSIDPHFWRGCHIVDYCSAACLLVEKQVFVELGGFDPLFDPAYYEDCDLCLRLRSIGLYTYFASEIEVIHDENMTSREVWGQERIRGIVSVNHKRFLNRWKYYLENRIWRDVELHDPLQVGRNRQTCGEPEGDRPKVLLRSEKILEMSPISRALLSSASALRHKFDVTIALPEVCSSLRTMSLFRHFNLEPSYANLVRISDLTGHYYDHSFSLEDAQSNSFAAVNNQRVMKAIYALC